ncbi:MAG: hypothetical protein K5644_06805, partial [Lachnospiraceae bacterium]|nr:hypothetical protein [Lachnospiraceae bacterium]
YGVYVAANYCLLRITGSVLLSTGFVTVGAFLYSMAIIFVLLKAEEKIKPDTSIRWLEWLGVHSMEIYLFHWLVENPIETWFIKNAQPIYLNFCNIVVVLVTLVISILYAFIYNFIKEGLWNQKKYS